MLLKEANNNAIYVAFAKVGKSVKLIENHIYVTYIDEDAKTNLKIGDEIVELNGVKINSKMKLLNEINKYQVNDTLSIKVVNNNNYSNKIATLKEENNRNIIGILITEDKKIETDPKVDFKFNGNESGPSGGLMETLYIYNSLTKKDITKGLTIVGTGTIESDGRVGTIGGVEFKLKGAVNKGADIFFVPNGENYEEAINIKNEFLYDIKIVGVDNFDDVLDYLNNI